MAKKKDIKRGSNPKALGAVAQKPSAKRGKGRFPKFSSIKLPKGYFMYTARGVMGIPTGAPHLRSLEFRLPVFNDEPVISATVYLDNTVGTSFIVYAISSQEVNGDGPTQVVVSAIWTHSGLVAIVEPIEKWLSSLIVECHIQIVVKSDGPLTAGKAARSKAKRKGKK